jgi:hypothetical protein
MNEPDIPLMVITIEWPAGDVENALIIALRTLLDAAESRGVSKRSIWRALDYTTLRARQDYGGELQ